jgi:ADP-ribose pyrophosphatase YjhB (NUDIX family)
MEIKPSTILERTPLQPVSSLFLTRIFEGRRQVLLIKTKKSDFWYFPSGKINKDETALSAVCREVKKELGIVIDVENLNIVDENIYETPSGKSRNIFTYYCESPIGDIVISDKDSVKEYIWTNEPFRYNLSKSTEAILLNNFSV